jgi:hypothetical protein
MFSFTGYRTLVLGSQVIVTLMLSAAVFAPHPAGILANVLVGLLALLSGLATYGFFRRKRWAIVLLVLEYLEFARFGVMQALQPAHDVRFIIGLVYISVFIVYLCRELRGAGQHPAREG